MAQRAHRYDCWYDSLSRVYSVTMTKALYVRKAMHAFLALAFGFVASWGTLEQVLTLAALIAVVFVAGYGVQALDPLRRAERKSIGELFFVAGAVCTALITLPVAPDAFLVAMLVLGLADTSASIVGRVCGGRSYMIFGEVRTYGGSFTVLVLTAVILGIFGMPAHTAIAAGWLLAAVEALSPRGSDNFVLPVLGALLYIWLV